LLPFDVAAGDVLNFHYTFDNLAACTTCASDEARYDNLLSSLVVSVNGVFVDIPLTASSLYLTDDHAVLDGYLDAFVLSFGGNDNGVGYAGTLALQNLFATTPATPFGTVDLSMLTAPPDPLAFPPSALPTVDSNFFTFSAAMDGGFNFVSGQLDSAAVLSPSSPSSVPEPSTLALMLVGLAAALIRRTRRAVRCR
jgi:hypothetical protein